MNRRDLLKLTGTLFAGSILTQGYAASKVLETFTDLPLQSNDPLYLHYNENALGLSPKAKQAILDTLSLSNRYPDPYLEELQQTIANYYQVKPTEVTLGVGSSDLIRAVINKLVIDASNKKQKIQLITPDPTFALAEDHAKGLGIKVVRVPLDKEYKMDIAQMKKHADNFNGYSIVYFCNPNNPTGTLTSSQTMADWVENAKQKNNFFIFDEAYAEYIDDPSFESGLEFVKEDYNNVIVLRTFSKLFAMAGMRVGYGIATQKFTEELITYMTILNISLASAVAATASIKDTEFIEKSLGSNAKAKEITLTTLDQLGIEYLPSHTNFIFHKIEGDPALFNQRMKEAGIIVGRPFPPYNQWCRVTFGTPEQMVQYTNVLKDFRKKGWI